MDAVVLNEDATAAMVAHLRSLAASEFASVISRGSDLSAYDDYDHGELGIEGWMRSFADRLGYLNDMDQPKSVWVVNKHRALLMVLAHDLVYAVDLFEWARPRFSVVEVGDFNSMFIPTAREERAKLLLCMCA